MSHPVWRCKGFLVLLPLLVGAGLRLYGLATESIWLDEATSILLGQADIPTLIKATAQDIHPPAYYVLLHFWLYLGDSEFIARALSAFLGVISIAVIYQLGAKLHDEATGFASALLLAISPLHIWYSQETRMYVLVTLWTMAGSFWLWRALQREARADWIAYILCMALALYTHYHAIFILLFQNCFVGIWWSLLPERRGLLRCWLMAQGGLALLFLPWVPVLLSQVAQGGGGWVAKAIGHPGPRALLETWIDFSLGNVRQWYPLWIRRAAYGLFVLALVAAFIASLRKWRRGDDFVTWAAYLFSGMYTLLPLGGIWLISQVKPMYAGRYLLPFLPPYLLLVAAGIRQLPWKSWRVALFCGLMAVSLVGVAIAAQRPQKEDWRSAVRYVLQEASPKDVVAFVPLWNFKPFDYYARGRLALYRELPVPLPAEADISLLLAPALADRERLWLIWSPGHYADPLGRVQEYLDGHFPRLLRGDFPGVGRISLYQTTGSR